MTKKDIIDLVAQKANLKRNFTRKVIECILDEFIDELAVQQRIEVRNFGVFKVKNTPARIGRNPKTKEVAEVPARKIVQFKAGKMMKELVNQGLVSTPKAVENIETPSLPGMS